MVSTAWFTHASHMFRARTTYIVVQVGILDFPSDPARDAWSIPNRLDISGVGQTITGFPSHE
jgi:hypothetical protein